MAYRKQCDYGECLKDLEREDSPYFQIHGSISEQMRDEYGHIEYRYLTPHPNTKLAFCDTGCFCGWVEEQKEQTPFVRRGPREFIPRENLY